MRLWVFSKRGGRERERKERVRKGDKRECYSMWEMKAVYELNISELKSCFMKSSSSASAQYHPL